MRVLIFSTIRFEAFLILRIIQRDIFKNVHTAWRKVSVVLVGFQWNLNFLDRFPINQQIWHVTRISPVAAELFHADGQADGWTDGRTG
jgi:hypothetical protein